MWIKLDRLRQLVPKLRPVYFVVTILVVSISTGVTGVIRNRIDSQETIGMANSSAFKEAAMTQRACTPSQELDAAIEGYKMATYKGVGLTYAASLASEIEGEIKAESRLAGETDKPEGVVPTHIMLSFRGPYADQHKSSYFTPEISFYSISKYKEALALSNAYVQSLEKDIQSLKTILTERQALPEGEIPFLPFGTDASQAFHSHLRYIDFKNGKGIIFLTQFNIEPSLVNNQGLIYTFQGLSDDGLYYVSARFPVTVPSFPPSYEANTFENYTLTMFYGRDQKTNEGNYRSYLARIKRRLDNLPPEGFKPNLTSFDKVISSLCVMPK